MSIRQAFPAWPGYNARLRTVVANLTAGQLTVEPAEGRWPLWATVGHTACQRISWICGFDGVPGADTTPFPDALHYCPGDEDLDHAISPSDLAEALDCTFRFVDQCLDSWTPDMLGETIRRQFGAEEWAYTCGAVIQRVFAHDISHIAELNEQLSRAGLPQVELWD